MPSILVIDDEVGMREGCRRALLRQGFEVNAVENGTEGLRKLREEPFDLVLLDAMMPGISGLEFLDRVQEIDPDLVCVVITGYATVELAAQAVKKGAQGFLPKPFTSDDLLAAVHAGLEQRRQRLALRQQRVDEEESRQLERTRQEQAKLDAMASRFLLVVAHELRNPAGAIRNYAQLMLGGYVGQDEWPEYVRKLDSRAGQLLNMLDDLLELAHLKEIHTLPSVGPLSVADILEEVAEEFRASAQAKGLEFGLRIGARPVMPAQAGHLRTMWRQLLANAISNTPHGSVTVSLSECPGWLVSEVTDTGVGIPPEDLPRIFEDFFRSDTARAETELGTGLGMPIVSQIVKIYRGTIQVESTPGQGTTFTIRLPIASAQEEASGG